MLNTKNLLLLSLLSALLLSLSWYFGLTAFIFVAFVPLLILEDKLSEAEFINRKKLKLICFVYLSFLLWNIGVTYWLYFASLSGAIMALLTNSILMTVVFVNFSTIKNRLSKSWAIWLLIPIWVTWEFIHLSWDTTWPWLSLGNVLAYKPQWIQWYEYVGCSGGTVWILALNILIFKLIKNKNYSWKQLYKPASVLILPILFSYFIYFSYKPNTTLSKQNIVIVQPNIDPYNEKFDVDFTIQLNSTLRQLRGKITRETDYLVFPETFVMFNINEDGIESDPTIQLFRDSILSKYPKLNIVAGINSYKFYTSKEEASATARHDKHSNHYYDVYNTAIQLNSRGLSIYHKSKLVPGVELMPFPALLKPLESFALDLGGTVGSLGIQKKRSVFTNKDSLKIAPVICYESIYGDYCAEYMRLGANLIFIITNDGWWDNTPGHKQHLVYARLRAIESRRSIARCANTGISATIDELGNISNSTNYWEEAVIQTHLQPNDRLTFYTKFGDIISRISVILTCIFLLYNWFLRFFKR